jgi:hypothetical protein
MPLPSTFFVLGTIAILAAAQPLHAAPNSWFGTWTLDRTRSHLTGTTIQIARTEHGYHFDFGAVMFDIGDDGAFYQTVPGRTTSLKALNDHEWLRIHRNQGKDVDRSTLRVSPDQNTLTIDTQAISPDGSTHTSQEVEQRIGSGEGLAGTWRTTEAGQNVPTTITLAALSGGRIQMGAPQDGNYFVVIPNGPPAANQGPRAVPDAGLILREPSPTELRWTETLGGKPFQEGIDKLEDDGSLLETSWYDHFPADRQRATYLRQ